jgi:hypothetical protein
MKACIKTFDKNIERERKQTHHKEKSLESQDNKYCSMCGSKVLEGSSQNISQRMYMSFSVSSLPMGNQLWFVWAWAGF